MESAFVLQITQQADPAWECKKQRNQKLNNHLENIKPSKGFGYKQLNILSIIYELSYLLLGQHTMTGFTAPQESTLP